MIAKTVMYEGKPIKNYAKRGKGVGLGSDETYLNYLMTNQWGDKIESVELQYLIFEKLNKVENEKKS